MSSDNEGVGNESDGDFQDTLPLSHGASRGKEPHGLRGREPPAEKCVQELEKFLKGNADQDGGKNSSSKKTNRVPIANRKSISTKTRVAVQKGRQ